MTEHPYITGFAAAVTGTRYVHAYEAWAMRVGREGRSSHNVLLLTNGYADGRSALEASTDA